MGERTCAWTQVPDGQWDTGCGRCFELTDGTPGEHQYHYCPGCGGELDERPWRDDELPDDCSLCKGWGVIEGPTEDSRCPRCKGTGRTE